MAHNLSVKPIADVATYLKSKATSIENKMSICRIDFYDNFPEVRGPTIDIFAKIFAIIPFSNCYCNITISVDKHELIICDRTY